MFAFFPCSPSNEGVTTLELLLTLSHSNESWILFSVKDIFNEFRKKKSSIEKSGIRRSHFFPASSNTPIRKCDWSGFDHPLVETKFHLLLIQCHQFFDMQGTVIYPGKYLPWWWFRLNKGPIIRSYCCIRVHRPVSSKVLPPSGKWIRAANPVTAAWVRAVSGQSPRLLLLSKIEVDFVSTWKREEGDLLGGFHTGRQPISFKNYYSYSDVATQKSLEWWLLMYRWMSTFCLTQTLYSLCHPRRSTRYKKFQNYVFLLQL